MLSALLSGLLLLPALLALLAALALVIYGRTLVHPFRLVANLCALALAGYAAFSLGGVEARGSCGAKSLKADLAAARADLEAARRLHDQTRARMAEAESLAARDKENLDALMEDLARRPDAACLLDDADARRLRQFGQPAQP